MNWLKITFLALLLPVSAQAFSQESGQKQAAEEAPVPAVSAKDPPYESKLSRLAEVLGSVHYLRTLCGDKSLAWRKSMEELLAAENPPPDRRARLIARFNHGYRAFDGVHQQCTETAGTALERYMVEGEKLADEIASRYAN